MPRTGWAMVSASTKPRPIAWFGLFDVPFLPVTKPIAGTAHELHETLGLLFAGLVLLHIAGALRHHLLLKDGRSEEHTSELQSLMRISYAVFCLKKKKN